MAGSVINTFDKGLHQDSAFILQPDGTYRNMKNGMLISYDGNHYTVELTKGNRVILSLRPRYLPANDGTASLSDDLPMPIGFISFIDKLVVFSTNNESTGGYGEIGVIEFTKNVDDFNGVYTPYYHHPDLNFSKLHKIEGFSFRENNNIERIYWTDNNNEPRVFDIANPIFTTYLSSGDLSIGRTYMVMGGVISNGGNWYGPSGGTNIPTIPNYVNGNIFTATNANFTTISGNPLVIEYFPLSLLDWTPTRTVGNIDFVEYGMGNKNCGNSIYFYRLSSSLDGVQTSWSYGSNPIHVGMDNEPSYITGTPYLDFVGNGSETTIVNSNKSIKLRIQNIDTYFDTIELCCAEFDQKTEIPYQITIVAKVDITSSDMIIEDGGGANLGTVTISDLTLFPASILKCKTLSTNKNYNIVANITEREEFELDLSGVTIGQVNYPMVCHDDYKNTASCANGMIPVDVSPTVGANPGAGDIYADSRWIVKFGNLTTDKVEYPSGSGIFYVTGDIITGIPYSAAVGDESTIVCTGTASVAPCTTRNKYNVISSGDRVEDYIEFTSQTTAFWDYKNPAVASHNKGHWSKEKYRYGILFLDLKGNPFYVKHLGDYTFDDVPTKGGLVLERDYSATLKSYSLNVSGATISGIDIPESIINKCSGFCIVRAERDPVIIAQGLVMQNVRNPGVNTVICPLGVSRTSYSAWPSAYFSTGTLCSFICPDHLVNYTFNNPIGVIGQTISEAFWLDGSHIKSYGTYNALVSRLLTLPAPYDSTGSPRIKKLKSMNGYGNRSFNEFNGDNNIIGTGDDYFNRLQVVNGSDLDFGADNNCVVGTIGAIDVLSTGCKKMVLFTENFTGYGTTGTGPFVDYSGNTVAAMARWEKIVMNILTGTSPANQYGGTSEQAIADTLYMSTGHFQPFTAQVKADTLNGTFATGIYAGEKKYTFNNIEIFGGDCFTNLVDVAYGLYDAGYAVPGTDSMGYQIWFPCEGNTNWGLNRGLKGSNKGVYPFSTPPTGVVWNDPGMTPNVQVESFNYNKGYSSDGTFIKYPALPNNYKFTVKFEYRMRWSALKYPGELINSFRTFAIPDYRDVDGQRGQINNLKARDSKLFYWQDHSVGYTPILERQLVGGSALGDATVLGVTGVIDRYDDIDTYFGNQHQHGLTETEYGFAWFDMRRRAFMVMGIGNKPEEMSMVKGLQVFFNNEFNEGNAASNSSSIYTTNNIETKEAPLLGYGIVGCYDPRFKMTYLTFKYSETNIIPDVSPITTVVNKDFTLGYNHILNAFVAFYDNCPAIWHNHNDLVLTANNPKSNKPYNVGMKSTSYVIGDIIPYENIEYICIAPVTITSYPGTLTAGGTNPTATGATGGDNDFWLAINSENEIYIQTFGAELCKFYGKVFDHEIDVIVNAKTDNAVTPQNYQFKGMGSNWTSVEASTDDQTASDMNISATNRNYRWIDKSWFANLPLPTNGRLTDYYVRIKFTFKNYVSDPTVSKNVQKVSQWLRTTFVSKR